MSMEISAQEFEWWIREWEAFKSTSVFRYQSETIKISYLCQLIDREILNAIHYRRFNLERDLLAAVLEYVNDRLHPTMIKQLNVLRSTIEGGQKNCDFLRNVCQDYFESDMSHNTQEQ